MAKYIALSANLPSGLNNESAGHYCCSFKFRSAFSYGQFSSLYNVHPLTKTTSSCNQKLLPITLTSKSDLEKVKMNQQDKHCSQ